MERAGEHEQAREAEFAARLRALENDAWSDLFDRHQTQIWRYSYARTGSRDAADELVAQVFAEALSSIHRYRDEGRPILAWLYAITRNLVSKHRRRAVREVLDRSVEPAGASVEDGIDSLVLAEALERLTSQQREVVVLRFYGGYSTREIARAMGKRETAVYSLEVRAIGALRRQLEKDGRSFATEPDKNTPLVGIDKVT